VAAAARIDRLVFRDDFNGLSLDISKWGVYNGGSRRAANTFVSNGVLTLRNQLSGSWTAAGLSSSRPLKQTYGRYVVRARFDRGYGIRAVALLWPAGGGWPPEIDFLEINANDPARTHNNLTNHFTEGASPDVACLVPV
jgi:beta-glucanase (GH16 family)